MEIGCKTENEIITVEKIDGTVIKGKYIRTINRENGIKIHEFEAIK